MSAASETVRPGLHPLVPFAFLLAVIGVWRLRRCTEARSRFGEKLTVVIVVVLGVLGRGIRKRPGAVGERRQAGRSMSPDTRKGRARRSGAGRRVRALAGPAGGSARPIG
ncbi:hypothetical protein OG985_04770 [Streptomyces sp. NBC_00289]|uniref:hypothetical protein n=1 Tax=Streptomyces sp. NBC_00289 TaxID=2975703 RepID=UPI00324D2D68